MSKASNLKAAAKLREATFEVYGRELSAKKENDTRWTSTMVMTDRYLKIRPELKQIDALDEYQLSKAENKIIMEVAKPHFMILFQLTKSLQFHELDLLFVRQEFDLLLADEEFACMSEFLAPDADIVACPDFENGLVKIMKSETLSVAEAHACSHLKMTTTASGSTSMDEEENELSTLERLERHRKKHKANHCAPTGDNANKAYIDVFKLISPTSNSCERLVSEAKYILVPHRRGLFPITIESIIYLKKNHKHWDVKTVGKAMLMAPEEEGEEPMED
jgi:hypothetical protein